ncbi:hypothetical protein HPC49_16265 [Pyxidicoccus fallax]|uniref:Transposase n=1 Tax=Pyxidicoccus fallax TaxID=394095 RepID=A0A848LHC0_9BACT|nr:hypothetical protein [Pyxidicoccus fallax]NMO17145.1 hypothetical protein [Pyxidicoccus fallax]NPC79774.1 hypothetical protein [Pyxidicoccus fallax]
MQVAPHYHALVPNGVFVPGEGGVRFEALPPPTQAAVERLLGVMCHRVPRLLERRGVLHATGAKRRPLTGRPQGAVLAGFPPVAPQQRTPPAEKPVPPLAQAHREGPDRAA